jgi:hypothetical protein
VRENNIRRNSKMKKEYDFSKGERGKFYKSDLKLNLPIYLEPEIFSFVESIAEKKNSDLSTVVNDLIKTDMQLVEVIE